MIWLSCCSCGCLSAEERHLPGDITLKDLQVAADNHGLSLGDAAANIVRTLALWQQGQRKEERRQ